MNVTLRHLRTFVAVAKQGSFTRAAATLCVSQPTVTKTIIELESVIGVPVFERSTREISLTPYGSTLLSDAAKILNDLDIALESINSQISGYTGKLRFACGLAFASAVMPQVIKTLNAKDPRIQVELIDDTSGGVIRRIESGEVDLGVGSYVGTAANVLKVHHLLSARLSVLFPPGYQNIPSAVTPEDLVGMPILRDFEDSSIAATMRASEPDTWGRMTQRVSVSNLDLQISLVREGVGACIMSAVAASHSAARGMAFRLISSPELKRDIYIFSRLNAHLSPAAARLLDILLETLPTIDFVDGVELGML